MRIVVISPRVAPGILTLATWDALREASRVVATEKDPHVHAIIASGIDVEISGDTPSLESNTVADGVVWIAPTGDAEWARTVADDLMSGDEVGKVEVIFGSYDVPGASLIDLVEVMDRLRRECPWTAEQTHASLAPYVLEEAQETFEALESGDSDHLREELGDLLMQVVFHSRIAEEAEGWDVDDVTAGITAKLVRRNPHVFAPETLDHLPTTSDEIDAQWQRIKQQERDSKIPPLHDH